jgi:hypothetical protein
MNNLAAASVGLAAGAATLLGSYLNRPQQWPPLEPRREAPAPVVLAAAPAALEPLPLPLAKGNRLDGVPRPPPPAPQPPPPPPPTAVAELAPALAAPKPRDPVCGAKGRTWYTKDNGWRYWRCNR